MKAMPARIGGETRRIVVLTMDEWRQLVDALKLCQVRVFMREGSENEAYEAARIALDAAERISTGPVQAEASHA